MHSNSSKQLCRIVTIDRGRRLYWRAPFGSGLTTELTAAGLFDMDEARNMTAGVDGGLYWHVELEPIEETPAFLSVYIAGPMSGKEAYNFPAFEAAAEAWRDAGWSVNSPHDITNGVWTAEYGRFFDPNADKFDWGHPLMKKMLRADLVALCDSDAIALLPGWRHSKGAKIELSVARALRLPVYDALTRNIISDAELDSEPDKAPAAMSDSEAIEALQFPAVLMSPLEEASMLVGGDRQADYGHPYDDYSRTARMWEAMLGLSPYTISPSKACLMMACVKISRQCNRPKRDNIVDLAGYAQCAWLCDEREKELMVTY